MSPMVTINKAEQELTKNYTYQAFERADIWANFADAGRMLSVNEVTIPEELRTNSGDQYSATANMFSLSGTVRAIFN